MRTNRTLKEKCKLITHASYLWMKRVYAHPESDPYFRDLDVANKDVTPELVSKAFRVRLEHDIDEFKRSLDCYSPEDISSVDVLHELLGEVILSTSTYLMVVNKKVPFSFVKLICRTYMRLTQYHNARQPFYQTSESTTEN